MTARYTVGHQVKIQNVNVMLQALSKRKLCGTYSLTDLVVVGDEAMLTHIYTMFKAEQIGHLSLRTLAETHSHISCIA